MINEELDWFWEIIERKRTKRATGAVVDYCSKPTVDLTLLGALRRTVHSISS